MTSPIATAGRSSLAEIKGKFGNLHLLVNNAGVKTLPEASQAKVDDWDNAVAVNFTAIYNGVAACLPHFKEHGEGAHIVTTALDERRRSRFPWPASTRPPKSPRSA